MAIELTPDKDLTIENSCIDQPLTNGISVVWAGNWSSNKSYYKNQAVFYQGSSYRANKTTTQTPSPSSTDWDILAQAGSGGSGGGASYLTDLLDVTITSPTNNQVLSYNSSTGEWSNQTISTGSGEVNTASNVGTAGVGVFKQKTGVELQFNSINAGSNKVSITNDTTNSEIDIDINEANLSLSNISGTLPISKGGTNATTASQALTNLGAIPSSEKASPNGVATLDSNSLIPDSQIPASITRDSELTSGLATKANVVDLTAHINNTSNPHLTTAAQIGAIPTTEKGAANGLATLDSSSLIPNSQISSSIARVTDITTTNLTGTLPINKGGTGGTTASQARTNLDVPSNSDLTNHTTNTSNPHSVTAAQVGNTTAQWNANQIQGVTVDNSAIGNGKVLKYNSGTNTLIYADDLTGSGGGSSTLDGLTDVTITSPTNGQALIYNSGEWINQTLSTPGEVNTASNVGASGVSVYKQKTGVNFEFKSINSASNKITITDDTTNNEIDIDVNEANLSLNNLSGSLSIAKGGTGSTTASAALTALGAASTTDLTTGLATKANSADLTDHINDTDNPHSVSPVQIGAIASSEKGTANGVATLDANSLIPDNQISSSITRDSELTSALSTKANTADLTSHTSNTSNPHSTTAAQVGAIATTEKGAANGVATLDANTLIPTTQIPTSIARVSDITATQVGNTTAQWNANQIQGIPVSSTAPTNGQILKFNGTQYVPSADSEGSGGGGSSALDGLTDVIITSPVIGQVLGYNGTNWVNSPPDALQFFNGPGYWYTPFVGPSLTNRSINAGTGRVAVIPIRRRCFVDSVSVNIATVASGVSVGLYLYNFDGNYIGDFGTIDASTTGWKFTTDLNTPIELIPGVYSIVVCGSGTITVSSYNNILNNLSDTLGRQGPGTNNNVGGFLSSFTFGSPPSTISLNYVSSEAPTVWFKVSSL